MPKKRKSGTEADLRTVIIKMLTGAAVGTAVYFALAAAASFISLKKDTAPEGFGFLDLALGAFAAVLCGFVAVKPIMKKGLIVGALSTMPMYFVIACICILVTHGGIGMYGWILGGVMLLAGAVGGIIAVK